MPALYSHTTRATGTILTATIYNGDHQNHIDNGIPQQLDDYSSNAGQMGTQTDPGEVGSESLPVSLAGELERLRFAIAEVKGTAQWYTSPAVSLAGLGAKGGYRNKVVNGSFAVTLYNNFVAATGGGAFQYIVDQWFSQCADGNFSAQMNPGSGLAQFDRYLHFTSGAANPINAGSYWGFGTVIEGSNVSELEWGTARAKPVTISFWVRSSLTGQFSLGIRNQGPSRAYIASYTINATNTWERKVITVPGDTTGTWDKTNGWGMSLYFCIGVGSTFATGSSNTWLASNAAGLTTQVDLPGTNGATFDLTGIQVETGSVDTPFDFKDFMVEVMDCQRFYETGAAALGGYQLGANAGSVSVPFKVIKRVSPTMSITSHIVNINTSSINAQNADPNTFRYYIMVAATGAFEAYSTWTASARF